jgi:hypothetical protein
MEPHPMIAIVSNSSPTVAIICFLNRNMVIHILQGIGHVDQRALYSFLQTYPRAAAPSIGEMPITFFFRMVAQLTATHNEDSGTFYVERCATQGEAIVSRTISRKFLYSEFEPAPIRTENQ